MNKRLDYHADKMKLVCILFAVGGVIYLLNLLTSYVAFFSDWLNLFFLYAIPFAASVCIYKLGNKKTNPNKLLGIFVLAQAVSAVYRIITYAISAKTLSGDDSSYYDYSRKEILIYLKIVCAIIILVADALAIYCIKARRFDRLFKVTRILLIVSTSIIFLTYWWYVNWWYVKPEEEAINVAAFAILLFGVFSLKSNIEEQLKQLNAELSEGTLSKEQYDEQRQKLLEKL